MPRSSTRRYKRPNPSGRSYRKHTALRVLRRLVQHPWGRRGIHTDATLVTPTTIQTSIPMGLAGSLSDGSTYNLRVSVTDSTLVDAPYIASSPITIRRPLHLLDRSNDHQHQPRWRAHLRRHRAHPHRHGFPGLSTGHGVPIREQHNCYSANSTTLATCQYLSANVIRIKTPNLLQSPIPPGLSGPVRRDREFR